MLGDFTFKEGPELKRISPKTGAGTVDKDR